MLTAAQSSKFKYRILCLAVLLTCSIVSLGLTGCSGVVSGSSGPNVTPPPTGDTTPPTVSMTAPASGAAVSGTAVVVSANATDNVAVASVQFQLDGANYGAAVTAAPYTVSWDSTKTANGSHTLRAIAKDTSNNSTTSAAVTVTVNNGTPDTTPPTVSMTAPANGATVSGTAVVVSANATDNVAVASVQFQLDGANVGVLDTASPYTMSWDSTKVANGSHTLRAIAKDTSNNSTTSAAVTVTVSNAADTTPPSVPAGLTATAVSTTQINLTWTASTDNVGVKGYNIYRGGTKVATSTTNSYQDSGLTAATSYTYNVSAFDAAGNTSAQSAGASATTQSSSGGGGGGGGIPTSLGWYQIPNTQLANACPNYADVQGSTGCTSLVGDWSGAIADTKRNRLLVWGGGHVNYFGNEVYAVNLTANPITLTRLNEPTRFTSNSNGCNNGAYWDGKPCARHTYEGITYNPTADTMVVFGGSKTPDGSFLINNNHIDIWSLDVPGLAWTEKGFNFGPVNTSYIPMSGFDPNSGLVFFHDGVDLYTYNVSTNALTDVDSEINLSFHNVLAQSSVVVDPTHKWLFVMGGSGGGGTGGNLYRYDISGSAPYTRTDLLGSATGCDQWLSTPSTNDANRGPGVEWDTIRNKIVMWNGGNSVGVYDPVANSCTTETYANGPSNVTAASGSGAEQYTGTQGRFRYFPALGVFVLVNDATQNAWILRIDPASGSGGGSSGPTISSVSANSITTTAANIGWTTDVSATSQVEYGTATTYGTSTTLNTSLVTAHTVALSGLTANTLYHYRVHSKNSAGTESISGDFAFQTSNTIDSTPPTVSIAAPLANATVSGAVTLTANATDNVGVTSVQFQLDSANLGSALTTSPYTMSWNTATTTNGAHTLSAQARDAAGNVGTSLPVAVTVANTTTTADQNFQQRCAAPGVLNCQGFDTMTTATQASDTNKTDGFSGSGDQANDNLDTSVFLSGGGSIRLSWPANDNTDNCCQDFTSYFGQGAKNVHFGQNSDFYVQFAFRADANWTSKSWVTDSFPKLFIMHSVEGQSCSQMSLVAVNARALNVPQMYTNCSGNPLYTCADGIIWASGCASGDLYSQQGWTEPSPFTGYQCGYNSGTWSGPNCLNFAANQWYTLYFHVHLGTFGTTSSTVEAWVAPYGQQMKKWLNTQSLRIDTDGSAGFNVIELTQFMTAHSTGGGGTGINLPTNTWFDELIISSQPIAAPAGQTP